jgi:polygalacturonase
MRNLTLGKMLLNMTLLTAAAILLFAASAGAQTPIVVTGDSRNVTEPVFPAVCMQLSAAIAEVNNDIPTSVDAVVTNPDGARIQAALNSCSTNSPGEAVELSIDNTGAFNAFLSGPLSMPSNVTLLVDPGVTLFFSRNAQDYDRTPGTHTCGTRSGAKAELSCAPLIDIPGTSSNVGIMGYGKLDGRAADPLLNGFATTGFAPPAVYTWWNIAALADQQNPRMIEPETGAHDITMYKITMLNSPYFHVSSGGGSMSNFTAWGVKIVTPTFTANTDGIDPDQAQNITVTQSWISDGDDDIAIGSSGTPGGPNFAQNMSITNNHFFAGHGESIGSNTGAGVNNILFDHNMLVGDSVSGKGSAINAVSMKIGNTTYPVNYADGNSTAIRIKSDQAAGGIVTNVQYSNSCLLDHNKDLLFTPLYNTDSGSDTPNVSNILLQNLIFMNDATTPGSGTVQFTGTDTVVNGQTLIYPLQITLSNVTFPAALTASKFTNSGSSGKEQYAQLTYGPGDISTNFITDWATFVAVPANNDTVTNNISVNSLNPPQCDFTFIAPELTGPKGLPETISFGQTATAVVILTPAVALAAYPTGTVTLTDSFNGNTTQATLSGTGDTIFVPLTGLGVGTHNFTMTYPGDAHYPLTGNQVAYSTAGPYEVTVTKANQTINFASLPATVNAGSPVSFTLNATGGASGNPVTFTVSGPATLIGTKLTTTGPGTITVTASQAGNANYNAATPVTQTIVVGTVQLTATAVLSNTGSGYQAVVTVTNSGNGTAQNVQLTAATLGGASGAVVPASLGTIAGGGSASVTLTFPSSAGTPGAGVVEKLTGTYTGGTFGGSFRATLPGSQQGPS